MVCAMADKNHVSIATKKTVHYLPKKLYLTNGVILSRKAGWNERDIIQR